MANRKDLLLKLNEVIAAYESLKNSHNALVQKLNDDTGVSYTDYEDNSNVKPLDIEVSGQLSEYRRI